MKDQRIVLVLLFYLIAGSNSQSVPKCASNQQLVNTVVYEGNSSSFSNLDDLMNSVTWGFVPSYDPDLNPPYLIADDNIVQPPFDVVYYVTSMQLGIPKASIYPQPYDRYSTSGLYNLTYKTDGCRSLANLIVVTNGPLCQCTASDSNNAVLSCELDYGEARNLQNRAAMTWYDDESGNQVHYEEPTPDQNDPYYVVSTSAYSITSSDAASYTCGVTFTAPITSFWYYMATNAPSFTASCTIENCVKPKANPTASTRVCVDRSTCESKCLSDREDFCQNLCGNEY